MLASPQTNSGKAFYPSVVEAGVRVEPLQNSEHAEVLAFMEKRPINTVCMAGLIRDNGLQSPLNRGIFYGCRDERGQIEGVGLIGHAILMETDSDRAIRAFANCAQSCTSAHMIMCEEDRLEKFWSFYALTGQKMQRACRELLFELRWPIEASQPVPNLLPATLRDLDLLIPVHAQMALEESGTDPLEHDPAGFYERYARRVERGRTWALIEDGKLLFKADVIAETPATTYVEGVWVNPEARRLGYGQRCMSQLARMLLWRTKSICLFVNDENENARRFYRSAGYHLRTVYDTIFLK